MIDSDFKNWLKKERGYSHRGASDAASRCRRAEKVLDIQLHGLIRTDAGEAKVMDRIAKMPVPGIEDALAKKALRATIRTAVRLYRQFLLSK